MAVSRHSGLEPRRELLSRGEGPHAARRRGRDKSTDTRGRDRSDSEEPETGSMGCSLPISVTTLKDSTQQCPAQSSKGWCTEGMHYGNLDMVGSVSGYPSVNPRYSSRQVAILLHLK